MKLAENVLVMNRWNVPTITTTALLPASQAGREGEGSNFFLLVLCSATTRVWEGGGERKKEIASGIHVLKIERERREKERTSLMW